MRTDMTHYQVAEKPNDYAAARALMRLEGLPDQELTFPTILAFDDEKIIGFIATTPDPDMILCGPLVLRGDKKRVFTGLNLVSLYENVMVRLGMRKIIFSAKHGDAIGRGIKKWFPKAIPYAEDEDNAFFIWPLKGLHNGR